MIALALMVSRGFFQANRQLIDAALLALDGFRPTLAAPDACGDRVLSFKQAPPDALLSLFAPCPGAYGVLYFGSHPDADNDDCWTGLDFRTEAEARQCFADDDAVPSHCNTCTQWIVLDGPGGVSDEREHGGYRPGGEFDTLWANEVRMQAAMMGDY